MMHTVLYFVVMALAMLGISKLLPGFQLTGFGPALVAAIVLALVNTVVRPILFVLTLPFTIVTLGLFIFVVNAICLALVAWLVPGFTISGFWAALFGAIVISLVSWLMHAIIADDRR